MPKPTDKQRRFVDEYLIDLNATQAAIRAGYSRKTAKEIAYELLTKPHIQAYLQKRRADRERRTEVTADKVVRELAKLGFSDLREVSSWRDEYVSYIPSEQLTDEAAAAIKEIRVQTVTREDREGRPIVETNFRIGMHDKKGALELLGRHLGLFTDNVNVNQTGPVTIRVRGLKERQGERQGVERQGAPAHTNGKA